MHVEFYSDMSVACKRPTGQICGVTQLEQQKFSIGADGHHFMKQHEYLVHYIRIH
jgi:hypothetical protein